MTYQARIRSIVPNTLTFVEQIGIIHVLFGFIRLQTIGELKSCLRF